MSSSFPTSQGSLQIHLRTVERERGLPHPDDFVFTTAIGAAR